MYETVNEPIRVLASFGPAGAKPLAFEWNGRRYAIDKINLVHTARDGRDLVYYFSVSDAVHYFKLRFSTVDLEWVLEEVFNNPD